MGIAARHGHFHRRQAEGLMLGVDRVAGEVEAAQLHRAGTLECGRNFSNYSLVMS
jgi:hypothetical protein